MAVTTTQLRELASVNYADNQSGEISPKDIRDGINLVADIMDAANIDNVIAGIDVYVQAARSWAIAEENLPVQTGVYSALHYAAKADASAAGAAADRAFVATAVADMVGGAVGQVLVKGSGTDFDYSWVTLENAGDMLTVIYDPGNVAADAFSMTNMSEGTTKKIFTDTERTKLAGIATGATANSSNATLLARANHTGTQAVSTLTGVTSTAAEINLLDEATDHDLTAWKAGAATARALISPAMLKAATSVERHYIVVTATETLDFTAIKAALDPNTMVFIEAWGGGGSGGRRSASTTDQVGGGGGGGYKPLHLKLSDVPTSLAITIGAGGSPRTSSGNGNNGSNTTVGSLITAYGGGGGDNDSVPVDGGAGGGSFAAGNINFGGSINGSDSWAGGRGGQGSSSDYSNAQHGGGGGSGYKNSTHSAAGLSWFGGNGGQGTNSIAPDGVAPGGGGAAGRSMNSGAGARGEVRIWI